MNTKNLTHYTLIISAFLISFSATAQYDAAALKILDAMSDNYQNMSGYKAKFEVHLLNDKEELDEVSNGEATVKQDKYRLKLDGLGMEIFNDATTVWQFIEEDNEVTITENEEDDPENLTLMQMYNLYKEGYKYRLAEEKTEEGVKYAVVDLNPDDKDLNFFRVRLTINEGDNTIKSWEVFEKNGRRYRYLIEDFKPNIEISDQFFVFDTSKHPEVEVVDLR